MGYVGESNLADSRQLVAGKHVHDTIATEAGAKHDKTRMGVHHPADDFSLGTQGMGPNALKGLTGHGFGDEADKYPFIGDIKRIEPEHLTTSLHWPRNWALSTAPLILAARLRSAATSVALDWCFTAPVRSLPPARR